MWPTVMAKQNRFCYFHEALVTILDNLVYRALLMLSKGGQHMIVDLKFLGSMQIGV